MSDLLCWAPIAGAFGGAIAFIFAFIREHYENDKYVAKALLEIAGGAITAQYLFRNIGELFGPRFTLLNDCTRAFLIGAVWGVIIEQLRRIITSQVRDKLGGG